MQNLWNDNWQEKTNIWIKYCPGTTLSTTNPTRIVLGFNPDLRGDKPATNRRGCSTGPI
jgi:hypothetical protein